MRKEYAIIGKRHIRAWHLWLFVGALAGAVGAVAFVAKNSKEKPLALQFEKSEAAYDPSTGSGTGGLLTILSPNGKGEVWVRASLQEFRWQANVANLGQVDVFLAGPVSGDKFDPSAFSNFPRYKIAQALISGAGLSHGVAGVPNNMPTGRYFLGMAVNGSQDVLDWSDGPISIIDADGLPHIGTAWAAPNPIRAGDGIAVWARGFKFFPNPGVLDILDGKGTVLASIRDTQPGKWVFQWSEEGSFSVASVSFDSSIMRGYAPGTYPFGVRVWRNDGKQSNTVFSSFTVK